MDKYEIIAELAKNKEVENIIANIAISKSEKKENLEELSQMIYLSLLEKEEKLIENLHKQNQLNYFIVTMIKNNLYSSNSRYEYEIRRWDKKRSNIEEE